MPAAVLLLFGQCQKDEKLLGPGFFQMHDLSALVAMAEHLFLVVQHFSFTADVNDCR